MNVTPIVCVIAWLVPGAGHLLLRQWLKGLVFLAIILTLFSLGLLMDGKLFSLEAGFFGLLRFIADAAIGLPYILGKLLSAGQGDIRSVGYEYGNTFLYIAGLLNMLMILDAYDHAQGDQQ